MSKMKKAGLFGTQAVDWKPALAAAVMALLGFPGWAAAGGGDLLVPVRLAAGAPGMIRFDTCTRPAYPEQEAGQNHQGRVTLRFLVGADGKVKESRVMSSSGYPALDEAARVAISKCSFNPPMANGQAVDAWVPVQYDWKPQ
jgi:TonB family protein